MKKTPLIAACSLMALLAAAPAQQQVDAATRAEQYYRHGLAAVQRGAAADARRSFEAALRINPGHANARFHLAQLSGNAGKLAAKSREIRLSQVQLPAIQFEDATLDEVLEALDVLVRKQTDGKFSPNFVIQDPSGQLAQQKVSIQLRNVPANAVLKYALDQARATARFDEHAVLVRPLRPAGRASETAASDANPGG